MINSNISLTLFFVDSVSKVRDSAAEDGRGEYLRIFDEEKVDYFNGKINRIGSLWG